MGGKQVFQVGGRVCVCRCILDSSDATSLWFLLSISEVRVHLDNMTLFIGSTFFSQPCIEEYLRGHLIIGLEICCQHLALLLFSHSVLSDSL